jgi:lipopolysaccharide transport system permease protein
MGSSPRSADAAPSLIIDAHHCRGLIPWQELWRARELLGFLAWRDVSVRYRQTLLGAAWAVLEPLTQVLLFTLIFHRLAGVNGGHAPYPVYCYSGILSWLLFSRVLRATTVSLVSNASLLTKAYFPRLLLPLSGLLATLVDFACALAVYFVLLACYHVTPPAALLTLPLWMLLAAGHALAVGLTLAAINVRFRDVSQAITLLTQLWMFATPVAYPLSTIPERWRSIYLLNPMAGVVEGMRWALLPDYAFDASTLVPGLLVGALALLVGLHTFRSTEQRLADIV